MFNYARLKLTAWYLLIIMFISLCFSIAVYRLLSDEVDRFAHMQNVRMQKRITDNLIVLGVPDAGTIALNYEMDPSIVNEAKSRIIWSLFLVNTLILVTSGGLGYFLAGKTLAPIKLMIDEQDRFISDASHELRTPLTSMKSSIEVFLRDKNPTYEDAKTLIAENLDDVNSMQELSDNLLKLSQYQKNMPDITFEKFSSEEIFLSAFSRVKNIALNKNINLVNKTHDFGITGNKSMLTDLIVILLDNAIKYSDSGSEVVLSSGNSKSKRKYFSVSDKGIGIKSTDIPHIFDRFYRADLSRTKNDAHGYGLGLSIAKKIADIHSANISIKSKPRDPEAISDSGSKFTVTFDR